MGKSPMVNGLPQGGLAVLTPLQLIVVLALAMLIEDVLRGTSLRVATGITRAISLTLVFVVLGAWMGFDWSLMPFLLVMTLPRFIQDILRMAQVKMAAWLAWGTSITGTLLVLGVWVGFDGFFGQLYSLVGPLLLAITIGLMLAWIPYESRPPDRHL